MITNKQQLLKRGNRGRNKQNVSRHMISSQRLHDTADNRVTLLIIVKKPIFIRYGV